MWKHMPPTLAAWGTSLDFPMAAWGSCHPRPVPRPHSYALDCEAVSLQETISLPPGTAGLCSQRRQLGESSFLLGVPGASEKSISWQLL